VISATKYTKSESGDYRFLSSMHVGGGCIVHAYVRGRTKPDALARYGSEILISETEKRLGAFGPPIILLTGIQDDCVELIIKPFLPETIPSLAEYETLKDPAKLYLAMWILPESDPHCVELMKLH
jgi:hypothetical protein